MLLVRGFLEYESGFVEKTSFKSYYLTLTYKTASKQTKSSGELLQKSKKFLLSSVTSQNYTNDEIADLNDKKLSLNVIKNIRDISGYEDERKSEKISTKLSKVKETQTESDESITRIEVAPSGEFVIQLANDIDPSSDLVLTVYSPQGEYIKEFHYSFNDLSNLAKNEETLKLKINTINKTYARRQFQSKPPAEKEIKGRVTSLNGDQIKEGLLVVIWGSNTSCNRFDQSKFKAIAITHTQENGSFSFKYSSKESYKTVYLSLTADEILAKKIQLSTHGEIETDLSIIFKSVSTKTLSNLVKDETFKNIQEEFFYYYAVRTSHVGFEDQVNSSNFIKAVSCFEQPSNIEMKQVGHGHVLVIKESWSCESGLNLDSDYVYSLSSKLFDDKFSDFYIGGSGIAINTSNPNTKFEQVYSSNILNRAFNFIEEKSKALSIKEKIEFKARSFTDVLINQDLFDVREALFIPIELSKFDLSELLMYQDLLTGKLLNRSFEPLLIKLKAYSEDNIDLDIDNLLLHVNQNLDYYHRLIWYSMDANRRFAILDNCISPNTNGKSIASVVENKILGILGNSIIMPVSVGFNFDPCIKLNPGETLLKLYEKNKTRSKFHLKIPSI
ncbi:MAG: hypothetical protein HRT47_08775 [Candidatus Caenarcaniphilales bacterium]|nr:hypothetical protein [Candidatus Caenarcaniphilales bacterium]